jgi:AraC family transcriptional regulator
MTLKPAAHTKPAATKKPALVHDRTLVNRFRKVLEYVDAHCDDELSIETLACVAGLSKSHFQRQFAGCFGVSTHKYVQLVRFHRASFRLAFRESSIVEIALDSGYESHQAFTRAFKGTFGQAPSKFRKDPDWVAWGERLGRLSELRKTSAVPGEEVRVEQLPQVRVTALEHRGNALQLHETLRRFIAWRRQSGLTPPASATFNLVYDEAHLDLCAEGVSLLDADGLVEKCIAGGRYAVLRHVGHDESLWRSVEWLYAKWLPASAETLRDEPLCLRRVRFFPDVAEHEAVTDVMLPLCG